jgi:putative membrane protein
MLGPTKAANTPEAGDLDLLSFELSARRTGLSFQRTRMSAERTLMSAIRTALALISFGFTIYQVFQRLREQSLLNGGSGAARNFGLVLVYLGIGTIIAGISYHLQFMRGLRRERDHLAQDGLVHAQSTFPVSFTLLMAIVLLLVGIAAASSLTFRIAPFD